VYNEGKRRGVTLGMHRSGSLGYSLWGIDDVLEGRSRRLRRYCCVICGEGGWFLDTRYTPATSVVIALRQVEERKGEGCRV
jgi:hypothetical protein